MYKTMQSTRRTMCRTASDDGKRRVGCGPRKWVYARERSVLGRSASHTGLDGGPEAQNVVAGGVSERVRGESWERVHTSSASAPFPPDIAQITPYRKHTLSAPSGPHHIISLFSQPPRSSLQTALHDATNRNQLSQLPPYFQNPSAHNDLLMSCREGGAGRGLRAADAQGHRSTSCVCISAVRSRRWTLDTDACTKSLSMIAPSCR